MDNRQRLSYLAAIGVQVYEPRGCIPFAALSQVLAWERYDSGESSDSGEGTLAEDTQSSVIDGQAPYAPSVRSAEILRPNVAMSPLVVEAKQPAVDVSQRIDASLPPLKKPAARPIQMRVGLMVVEWPRQLRAIIELGDPSAPSLSAAEFRLWREICFALWGREKAESYQSIPIFRFPPNANLLHLGSPKGIRDAVDSLLQNRQQNSPVPMQVCFAGSALMAAYSHDVGEQLLMLPSLTALQGSHILKKEAWAAIAGRAMSLGLRDA